MFTGQEIDQKTGLIYFGARFYDSDVGRFINQDSYLGELRTPPSLHRYLYAYSNPTYYIDPNGNQTYPRDVNVDRLSPEAREKYLEFKEGEAGYKQGLKDVGTDVVKGVYALGKDVVTADTEALTERAKGVANTVLHPIDTGTEIYNSAKGKLNKANELEKMGDLYGANRLRSQVLTGALSTLTGVGGAVKGVLKLSKRQKGSGTDTTERELGDGGAGGNDIGNSLGARADADFNTPIERKIIPNPRNKAAFVGSSHGDIIDLRNKNKQDVLADTRELRAAEISKGRLAKDAKGQDELVTHNGVTTGIDVIDDGGNLIQVGGPGKGTPKRLPETLKKLKALKAEADLRGVEAKAFYEGGDSNNFKKLIEESKKIVGEDNVVIMKR